MRRRAFMAGVGSAAAWPLMARAQQAAMPLLGFLNGQSPDGFAPYVEGFRNGLKDAGFVVGRNVEIEYRWARGRYETLRALAAELVARRPAVLVAAGGRSGCGGGQGGDPDHTHRFPGWGQPHRKRLRGKLQPARRHIDRRDYADHDAR
jgi:putative tryptophan/tyrosine transport system substrate-binding protein